MTYNPKITLVRLDNKQKPRVSTLTLNRLLDKLTDNLQNEELAQLRTLFTYHPGHLLTDRHRKLHRLYPSVKLRKGDDGSLQAAGYNDLLLLSAGPILEAGRLPLAKRMAQVLPSTVAAFVGSSGQTLKILVRVTLPDDLRQQNETEMEHFFRKAYDVASTLYGSILQLPVGPSGIADGS